MNGCACDKPHNASKHECARSAAELDTEALTHDIMWTCSAAHKGPARSTVVRARLVGTRAQGLVGASARGRWRDLAAFGSSFALLWFL